MVQDYLDIIKQNDQIMLVKQILDGCEVYKFNNEIRNHTVWVKDNKIVFSLKVNTFKYDIDFVRAQFSSKFEEFKGAVKIFLGVDEIYAGNFIPWDMVVNKNKKILEKIR